MTELTLPGMSGHIVGGWVPALGLARVLVQRWPHLTMRWDDQWACPVLGGGPSTVQEAADTVWDLTVRPEQLLPGLDLRFPPEGARGPALVAEPWTGPDGPGWQTTLVAPDGQVHPILQMWARQTLRGTLAKLRFALTRADLVAALTALGISGSYTSGLWLLGHVTEESGRSVVLASPGRDWLALQALPWMPLLIDERGTADARPGSQAAVLALGWHPRDYQRPVYAWSLWSYDVPVVDIPRLLADQHLDLDQHLDQTPLLVERRGNSHGERPFLTPVRRQGPWRGPAAAQLETRPAPVTTSLGDATMQRLAQAARMRGITVEGLVCEIVSQSVWASEQWADPDVLHRLALYGLLRDGLHDDIRHAHERGLATQADLARISGLSRGGIAKILTRPPDDDALHDDEVAAPDPSAPAPDAGTAGDAEPDPPANPTTRRSGRAADDPRWFAQLQAVVDWRDQHDGRTPPLRDETRQLASWLSNNRAAWRAGRMPDHRRAAFDAAGLATPARSTATDA